ncbi:Hsp70 family protein, partial [Nocardia sp. NPDC005998]|uniref:Hsp70 family protein n=1 Tax=Nocardia sp. NPDC005998 TaxID=3156894 RepID=UPI0033A1DBF9
MNSISAMVTGGRSWSSVRTRRTAVAFDSAGGIRIGGIPQFTMAVTDFADLARDPEPMIVGGRLWSPANLVAAVVNGLLESFPPTAGAVATYPACYSDKQLSLLRQALNLAGAADVMLVPEPVAAAEWLEHERGPLESGFVLVYDLGGASLDVSMVRVGPDWDDHPIVGRSMRSYDFGGRPLGSMIARYARVATPGDNGSMLQMTSIVDIGGLRTQHIRDSFDVVRECVESTGRSLSDVDCILLVGGATRPVEVARTIAELGRPVVMSTDPGQTVAVGAAGYAARNFASVSTGGRHRAPKVAVFSSAAVASAVAVSAVTVFGGPTIPEGPSLVDAFPHGRHPMDNLLFEPHIEALADAGSAVSRAVDWASNAAGFGYSGRPAYGIAPVDHVTTIGPSVAEAHWGSHQNPRSGPMQSEGGTYANPAQFLNPLPFVQTPQPAPELPAIPAAPMPIPRVSIPGSVPAPNNSVPTAPTSPPTGGSGTTTPGTGTAGTHVGDIPTSGGPATGTPSGQTPSGTATPGGTSSADSWSGTASGNTHGSTWGGTSSNGSNGTTPGGSTNGSTSGTSGPTGSGTSGGSTSGSTSGGSASGGTSSGSNSGHTPGGSNGDGTQGGSNSGHTSGAPGSSNGGGTSGAANSGRASGDSGGSDSGGALGGSNGGGASGAANSGHTSGAPGGLNGGGASGAANSGRTSGGSGGSDSGGASGGLNGGGALGGSDGGGGSGGSNGGASGAANSGHTSGAPGGLNGGGASGAANSGRTSGGSGGSDSGGASGGLNGGGALGGLNGGGALGGLNGGGALGGLNGGGALGGLNG